MAESAGRKEKIINKKKKGKSLRKLRKSYKTAEFPEIARFRFLRGCLPFKMLEPDRSNF